MRKRLLLVTGLFLCLGARVLAGGFQISPQGIKALGMGGSLTGRAFDAGTVFFNPGGMTALQQKTVLNAGIAAVIPRTSFLGTEGQTAEDDGGMSLPFHVYFSTRLKNENLTAGISINNPFGYSSNWKDDWTGRFVAQSFRIRTTFIQPTAAYKFNDHWSAGAGPVIALGGLNFQRALPYTTASGKESSVELDGGGSGIGFNAGIYYSKNKFTAGLSYRSGVKMKIKDGTASFNDIPALLLQNGTFPAETTFDSELKIPDVISLAAGYTVNEKIILTLGLNYTRWSVFESLDYDFSNVTVEDIRTARKFENTMSFRAGIEGKAFSKITLRGGVALDASPVPDGYFSPDMPDDDKVIVSGGLSWQLKTNLSLDASFMFENVRERRETTNIPYDFNGTYNSYIYIAGLGIQYQF